MRLIWAFVRDLLDAGKINADFIRSFANAIEKIANYLMAVRGHTDTEAGIHECRDHARTGVGLAGAGRTLNRQDPGTELEHQPNRGFQGGFTRKT